MKTIGRIFFRMPVIVMFFTVVPLFYFLFVLAYRPFDMEVFLACGAGRYSLNLIVSTLIVLGVMVLSRMLMYILRNKLELTWPLYILWCVVEAVLCGLFLSIPMGIGWAGVKPYFTVMLQCALYMAGILVYPLSVISMAVQMRVLGARKPLVTEAEEKTLIRFLDDGGRLKLVVSAPSVLYVEAEENYVHIFHLDGGRVKDFELRSSMRALEDLLARHGLVRCHRSYFVNPSHVQLLKKDPAGYASAQLDRDGLRDIPVSKKYYDSVTALL